MGRLIDNFWYGCMMWSASLGAAVWVKNDLKGSEGFAVFVWSVCMFGLAMGCYREKDK
jgi:hypothetical protein